MQYDEKDLPSSSVSSREYSALWAKKIAEILPDANLIFSSEKYGEYVSEYLGIEYENYDIERINFPVSATQIRLQPFTFWDYLPQFVKPYFLKKICLVGSESTGKSTLTRLLAEHYQTLYVPEMARDIIQETDLCSFDDLSAIATLHAKTILEKSMIANKLLFVDTDVNITRSYGQFLFGKELLISNEIASANKCDIYFFLETDCPFIQDGTRLEEERRECLSGYHKKVFTDAKISLISLKGNWDERLKAAISYIDKYISGL